MPVLDTTDDISTHLREAVRGGRHWLFATDSAAGRECLRLFAGGAAVAFGVPAADIALFESSFIIARRYAPVRVTFVTVAKSALPRPAVAAFLALVGFGGVVGPDRDLFPMGERPEVLAAILTAVHRGEFESLDPTQN